MFCNEAKKGKCNNKEYVKQEFVVEKMEDMLKGVQISIYLPFSWLDKNCLEFEPNFRCVC
jgi:hypothetical protein